MDIQVVGGGALGMSAALALAEEGHDVTLVERRQLGAGATGKAAGILSTMTWNDDDFRLIQATRGKIGELISLAAGPVPEARGAWRPVDSITIAKGDKLSVLDAIQHRLERFTEEPERMDHRRAADQFPEVRFHPGEEVLVAQEDGCIEAGDFLAALRWRLESEGVVIKEGAGDAGDAGGAGRVGRADMDGPTVVAGGAWTKRILADAGVHLPMEAFRTQLASLGSSHAEEVPIVHDVVHGFYMRPESAGTFLAGDGTRLTPHDPEEYDEAGDPGFTQSIAERVPQRLTHGADATIRRSWAGLCVATPDRRPFCGPVPDRDDLWVLTGDNGFGLMRCLALGERLAQAVDGDVHPETDPRRFAGFDEEWEIQEGFGF